MSAQKEQELLMQEIEQEEKREKAPQVCAISKSGITLFGFHVSWMVVILVAVLIFFWLHQSGMLPESIKDVLSGSESSKPSVESSSVSESPKVMSGGGFRNGFKQNPFSSTPGQVRKMMGH
jgi:hypothetical protein